MEWLLVLVLIFCPVHGHHGHHHRQPHGPSSTRCVRTVTGFMCED